MKECRINVRLPADTHAKLRALCRIEGKSLNGAVRVLIEAAVVDVVVPEKQRSAESRLMAGWR